MERRIGAPGPPASGAREDLPFIGQRAVGRGECFADPEIGGGKGIALSIEAMH